MKITRNTPEQLIISYVPWLWGIMFILFTTTFLSVGLTMVMSGEMLGLVFALGGGGIGALAFVVFVRRVQVILHRPAGLLILRSRTVFGYSEVTHPLSDLDGAVLEETIGSKGGTLYRPTLVLGRGMSAGRHPILQAYTNSGGPKRAADAINTWLAMGAQGKDTA